MLCGGVGSVSWAEQYISSSLAAIIVTALPFWFVIFDKKKWSFYFSNKMIIVGLLVGFAGVILLLGFDHTHETTRNTGRELVGGNRDFAWRNLLGLWLFIFKVSDHRKQYPDEWRSAIIYCRYI